MGKNAKMLKCFFKIITNNKEEIEKIIPEIYEESFYKIDEDYLIKNSIDKLILDIDGTLLPADEIKVPLKLKNKIKKMQDKNIKLCLVSNNGKERVVPVAKELKIDNYLYEAKKPLKIAFDKSMEILNTKDKNQVAMVGDQMMSDIKGASEYNVHTILVKPVSNKHNIQTKTSRILQDIIEAHLKKINKFDKDKYYKKVKVRK